MRAVGTPDVGPGLRQGLEALEHSAVAIRGMFRALADATYDATWLDHESAEDLLLGLAQTFRELAAGVDAFGQLVRDEADPANRMTSVDVEALREALEGLHEARARLEDLLTAGDVPGAARAARGRALDRPAAADARWTSTSGCGGRSGWRPARGPAPVPPRPHRAPGAGRQSPRSPPPRRRPR